MTDANPAKETTIVTDNRGSKNTDGRSLDYASAPSPADHPPAGPSDGTAYGSDLIVDALIAHDIEYIAINPGASFRGLHDSLVNHGEGRPQIILCNHENIAVGIAQGYAKAQSPARPMAVALHNIVGLLNGARQTYISSIDRCPVIILGGTGPVNEAQRRPSVDWHHTANVQGNAVRDFVKWDDQPATVDSIADSFGRAYRIALSEPQGPVYLCYDAQLQEDPVPDGFDITPPDKTRLPSILAPDPAVLDTVFEMVVAAKRPVIIAQYLGRNHDAVAALVQFAETLGIPVVDIHLRPNFPTAHRLNLTGSSVLSEADLILALDAKHPDLAALKVNQRTRTRTRIVPESAKWIDIGFGDLEISSWATDYGQFRNPDVTVLADTSSAVPALARLAADRVKQDTDVAVAAKSRSEIHGQTHDALRAKWAADARKDWDAKPMTTGRLALEVWDAVKDEDWVLSSGTLAGQVLKLWDIDKPYRHPGSPRGPGTQIGISLGVALAHKGKGRLVIDFQPDGDLMYDAGALWVAAKYEIPILVIMFNNRAYYQDWMHQIETANQRGTPIERAGLGQDIDEPAPDFAALARSMGCYGEGPFDDPADLAPALARAIAEVKQGRPALIDALTRFR
jgi:acetolactate synthase-1/2/3 large subunit